MKAFQVTSAIIEVSANPLVKEGMIANFKVTGVLPGCRKSVQVTEFPSYQSINLRPLFGYNGSASIHPDDWRALIQDAPIVSAKYAPVSITSEVIKWALNDCYSRVDCPAVQDDKDVHPNFKVQQAECGWTPIVRRPMA